MANHPFRKPRTPVDASSLFLGGLSLDEATVSMGPEFVEMMQVAAELRAAYRAHAIAAEEMASLFAQLRITDIDGTEWTLGPSTLEWYSREPGGTWTATPAPGEDVVAAASVPDLVAEALRLAKRRRDVIVSADVDDYSGQGADGHHGDASAATRIVEPGHDIADRLAAPAPEVDPFDAVLAQVRGAEAYASAEDDPAAFAEQSAGPFGDDGAVRFKILDPDDVPGDSDTAGLLETPSGAGETALLSGTPLVAPPETVDLDSPLADLARRPEPSRPARDSQPADAWSDIEGVADDELLRRLLGPED